MSEYRCIGSFSKQVKRVNDANNSGADVYSVTKYDGFVRSLDYFKKQVFSRDLSAYKIVKKGEFAYSTIHLDEGALGLLADEEALISPMYTTFEVDGSVDRSYLSYLLKSTDLINQYGLIGQGSVNRRKSVPFSSLAEIEVYIPPLPEQKKIAEILSGIDVSICLQKNKAEKYQTMITFFRDNLVKQLLRKESTKILPLDNVSRVIDSLHSTPVFTETGIPMVRVTDIKTGVLSLENTKKVTSEAYKLYIKNHEPAEGDIVISRVGSYGITSLNTRNQKFCLGQNTALIHPTSIDGCFLYECLNSSFLRDQVEFMVEGSGYKSLSLASIRSLRIPVPSAIDQCELLSFLKSIQKSLAIEVEYGKKLAVAKNALSSDLLSGRKRVST